MPWPAYIESTSSRLTDTEPIANKFNGLYDAIIHECFPSSQFVVTPQYPTLEAPEPFGVGASNFAISFVIEPVGLESPVLFIEVKPPTYIQIRARFGSLDHLVRIPKLYGISAIGAVEPAALPADPNRVIDTAPVERWANIMQEEGRTKFLAMVEEIKQMVRAI
ncbi:hypothetical protein JOM56_001946 [Amanita muscaria]